MDPGHIECMVETVPFGYASLEIVRDAPCGRSTDYTVVQTNRSFAELAGLPVEKIVGRSAGMVLPRFGISLVELLVALQDTAVRAGKKALVCLSAVQHKWFRVHLRATEDGNLGVAVADITDERASEEALRKSESRFQELARQNRTVAWEVDQRGLFTYMSEAALEVFGYEPHELVGKKHFFDLHPVEGREEIKTSAFTAFHRRGPFTNLENVVVRRDGTELWVSTNGIPLRSPDGNLRGYRGTDRDISAQKRWQTVLHLRESYLDAMIENLPGPAWLKDAQSRFLAVNSAFAKSCAEANASAVARKTDYDVWPRELAQKYRDDDARVMATRQSRIIEEPILDHGQTRWFETFKAPVFDGDGLVVGTVGYARDITLRKQTEEAIRRQSSLISSLLDSIPDIVSFKDEAGVYLGCNPAFARLAGRTKEEIVGKTDYDLFSKEKADLCRENDRSMLEHREPRHDEEWVTWPDGRQTLVDTLKTPYWGPDGALIGILGISRDITARKQAEERALAASKAKSEFLANMSHEIRTPLNAVVGFTELLLDMELNEPQKQHALSAHTAGLSLLGIVNDILDFSKIEAGKLELDVRQTDLVELMEQTADIVKLQTARKGLELVVDIPPDMPPLAWVDATRLRQVFVNLLNNAVKFTERGQVEFSVAFTPLPDRHGSYRFSVQDTGIGISEEQQPKLFRAFTQADSSTTRRFGGTGLGLTISKMLVERMGGSLELESEIHRGSRFSFAIRSECSAKEGVSSRSVTSAKRALVVDDNEHSRALLVRDLECLGVSCRACDGGSAALKLLRASSDFDVAVVDYHMPGMDGIETVTAIRESLELDSRALPVILLRNPTDDEATRDARQKLKIRGTLVKPVKSAELRALLSKSASRDWPPSQSQLPAAKPWICSTILVVDDVPTNLLLVTSMLARLVPNARVVEASSGVEAIELSNTRTIDLILMDVQMPGVDGLAATRAIREREERAGLHTPIVALTAGALKAEQDRCIAAGMDAFLSKPVMAEHVRSLLQRFLPGRAEG